MSRPLYRNNSSDDEILPQKEFRCTRCNQDINEPIEEMDRYGHLLKKERPYTFYKGKLVCLRCFFELEKTDPISNNGKTVKPNPELF